MKNSLINRRFGEWKVVSFAKPIRGRTSWGCLCSCGTTKVIQGYSLQGGYSRSCGATIHKKAHNSARWRGIGELSQSFVCHIKNGAKHRQISFKLSILDLWNLFLSQQKLCAISKIQINFPITTTSIGTASLDRIDSSKGYIKGNVQWIHKDINYMKQDYSQEEFIEYCHLVSKNNK